MLYWLFRSRSNEQLLALWLVLTDFFFLVLLQSVYVVCCSLTSLSDIVTSRLLVWIMTWFSLLENTLHIYSYGLRNKWFLCSEYVQTHTCDICYCVCFSVQMNMKSFYFSCLLYDDNKLSNLISYSPQQCRNFAFRQHLPTISFMFWHLREKSDIKTENLFSQNSVTEPNRTSNGINNTDVEKGKWNHLSDTKKWEKIKTANIMKPSWQQLIRTDPGTLPGSNKDNSPSSVRQTGWATEGPTVM